MRRADRPAGIHRNHQKRTERYLLIGSHLRIFQCDAISDNGNSVSTADLLDIPLYDNIAVFLIKLYGEANSVGLLACDKRRTTATEGSSTIQL
jgi:hypothetical protein